jgi:hypothetical protein
MSDDSHIHGSRKISQFPEMPDPSTLYAGCLIGNYKESEDASWRTGVVYLSEIGGGGGGSGDTETYLENLPNYDEYDYEKLQFLINAPYNYGDRFYWADSCVITDYLSTLPKGISGSFYVGRDYNGTWGLCNFLDETCRSLQCIPPRDPPVTYGNNQGLIVMHGSDNDSVYRADAGEYLTSFMSDYLINHAYDIYLAISQYLNN